MKRADIISLKKSAYKFADARSDGPHRLLGILKSLQISQKRLAEQLGYHHLTINRYLIGAWKRPEHIEKEFDRIADELLK